MRPSFRMGSFGSPSPSKSKWEADATAFFDATIYRGTLLQPEWMANATTAVEAVLDKNLVNTKNLKLFRKLASRLPTRTAENEDLKNRAKLKIIEVEGLGSGPGIASYFSVRGNSAAGSSSAAAASQRKVKPTSAPAPAPAPAVEMDMEQEDKDDDATSVQADGARASARETATMCGSSRSAMEHTAADAPMGDSSAMGDSSDDGDIPLNPRARAQSAPIGSTWSGAVASSQTDASVGRGEGVVMSTCMLASSPFDASSSSTTLATAQSLEPTGIPQPMPSEAEIARLEARFPTGLTVRMVELKRMVELINCVGRVKKVLTSGKIKVAVNRPDGCQSYQVDPHSLEIIYPAHDVCAAKVCDPIALEEAIRLNAESIYSLNADKELPLHLAAREGHAQLVRELLTRHAEADRVVECCLAQDRWGDVPLHNAARQGHLECIEELLKVCPEAVRCTNKRRSGAKNPLQVAQEAKAVHLLSAAMSPALFTAPECTQEDVEILQPQTQPHLQPEAVDVADASDAWVRRGYPLLCKFSHMKLQQPARGPLCMHLDWFEFKHLKNYVRLSKKCPFEGCEAELVVPRAVQVDKELQELLKSFDKELQEPPREVELRRHAGKLEIRRSQSTAGAPICAPSKKRARSLADAVERVRVKLER